MSDFVTVIVSNDDCVSLGMSMPHEEIIIPMPSNMAHAIAFFFFMLFLYFSCCLYSRYLVLVSKTRDKDTKKILN